jgi:hypothetical protein
LDTPRAGEGLVGKRWEYFSLEGLNYLKKQPNKRLPSVRKSARC